MKKILVGANKEIDHFWMEIGQGDKTHTTKRANFTKESKRLLKIAEKATWDMATKLVQNHS